MRDGPPVGMRGEGRVGGSSSGSSGSSAAARWSVAFAAAVMNAVQTGAFFMTPTSLMPEIVERFGLSLSLSTVPIAVGKVAYVLLLIPGGMVVDAVGPRRCVLGGLLCIALLMSAYAALVSTFAGLLTAHVLLAAAASVSGVPVYSIFIAQWFSDGIGLAMGLVLAGFSAAGTLVPAFLGPIASDYGWRAAMGCMAGVLWFVGLPIAYFFLHEGPQADDPRPAPALRPSLAPRLPRSAGSSSPSCSPPSEVTPLLLPAAEPPAADMRWTFAGFATSYILLQYCFGCFGENIMFYLHTDCRVSIATASLYFSALNFASFSAKLVGGHLGDRYDRFHVAAAASGLAGVGIIVLFCTPAGVDEHFVPHLTTSHITILLFVLLFGFGYGATFNSLYALVPIVFGRRNLGTTQSTLFGLGLTGNAIGSVLTGVLRAKYGTYQRPFLVAAVACIANFFTFNLTRMSLGGSMRGLKAASTDAAAAAGEEAQVHPFQRAEELEALRARDMAVAQRIGAVSDAGTPRSSPPSSMRNLGSGFFGAAFAASPSTEHFFARMSPPPGMSVAHAPFPRVASETLLQATELQLQASIAAAAADDGEGLQPVEGFPIARDWSSPSLRVRTAAHGGSATQLPPPSPGPRPQPRTHPLPLALSLALRRSRTAENMIRSGVMSASLEAPGYLGHAVGQQRRYASFEHRHDSSGQMSRGSTHSLR